MFISGMHRLQRGISVEPNDVFETDVVQTIYAGTCRNETLTISCSYNISICLAQVHLKQLKGIMLQGVINLQPVNCALCTQPVEHVDVVKSVQRSLLVKCVWW